MDIHKDHQSHMKIFPVPRSSAHPTAKDGMDSGSNLEMACTPQHEEVDTGRLVVDAVTDTDDLCCNANVGNPGLSSTSVPSGPRSTGILVVDKTELQHSPMVKTARLHATQISVCRKVLRVCTRSL